ncbi:MAG: hypothetical protein ABIL05_03410 [candidate division WOR-3 bacterium]
MRFADPIYFILFLPLALLILWEMFKKRGAVSFSDLSYLRKISRGGRFLSSIPQICLFVSLGLSIFGLARPQQRRSGLPCRRSMTKETRQRSSPHEESQHPRS